MRREPVIERLWSTGERLAAGVQERLDGHGLGEWISLSGKPPWKILAFRDHPGAESAAIKTLYMVEMIRNGVLTLGTHNVCYAHDEDDIQAVLAAYDVAFERIAGELARGGLVDRLPVPVLRPVFQVRQAKPE